MKQDILIISVNIVESHKVIEMIDMILRDKTTGTFKKGNKAWNKGMRGIHMSPETEFKEGGSVGRNHPSWTGGVQRPKGDCIHLWDGTNRRKRRPVAVYEEQYRKVPDGFVIYHKDGDKGNDSPENLEAISRAELMNRNRKRLIFKRDD